MKLSEAIRAGAKIRPQGFGSFETAKQPSRLGRLFGAKTERKTCAWGAAMEAVGGTRREHVVKEGERISPFRNGAQPEVGSVVEVADYPVEWHQVTERTANCPQCKRADSVFRIMAHLNDDHRWTREEIALFVERVESDAYVLVELERQREDIESRLAQQIISRINDEKEWPEVIG